MRNGLLEMVSSTRRAAETTARTATALVDALWHTPRIADQPAIVGSAAAPVLEVGRPVSILCWNVQFGAGRSQKFFYDGGDAVHVPPSEVTATLDRIGRVLRDYAPDIVLLQEVDRGSDRTGRVDQHAELLARAPYPCHTSTPYHRNRYVPFPPSNHLGRIDMHLSVFSRFRMTDAIRWRLPELMESWVRRQFNLRRALLELTVPLSDGRTLGLFDVHLSAFSRGDGTLPRQLDTIVRRLGTRGPPFVIGGDFNALPPGDDPTRLGTDAALYADEGDPIGVLYDTFPSAISAEAHRDTPERYRTWLPPGLDEADRAIDHLFVSPGVEVLDATVLTGITDASDHLPMWVELQVSEDPYAGNGTP